MPKVTQLLIRMETCNPGRQSSQRAGQPSEASQGHGAQHWVGKHGNHRKTKPLKQQGNTGVYRTPGK